MAELPEINIDECGKCYDFSVEDQPFKIEIISSTEDYIRVLKGVFDFERSAVLSVEPTHHRTDTNPLHSKVRIQTTRVVTGGKDEASVGNAVLACATHREGGERLPNNSRYGGG